LDLNLFIYLNSCCWICIPIPSFPISISTF